MISGRDIVIVSSVDWGFLWQGQHEVASRLARAGNRVLYIENMGVRSPRPGDAKRVVTRLRSWLRSVRRGGVRPVAPGLYVCSPLVLPPFGRRWQRVIQRTVLLPLIRRAVARLGMRNPVLWTYLPTDTALDVLELLRTPRSVVVYACVADWTELAPRRDRLGDAERTLLRTSDLVFAQGSRLISKCARWSARVHPIDCAINFERFSQPHRRDPTVASLPSPIIGYVGGLHRLLDLDLVVEIARARPRWSWLYVGPIQAPVNELALMPNVRLVGRVRHERLAEHIAGFDVCTVPYSLVPDTDTVFPTKVLEYLAVGKPVVSTDLPELREFNAEHGVVSVAASHPEAFLDAIERVLASPSDGARAMRRRAAESRDWTAQLARMSDLIEASAVELALRGRAAPA